MESSIVWIDYYPRLYQDLLVEVFEQYRPGGVRSNISILAGPSIAGLISTCKVSVVLFSPGRLRKSQKVIYNKLKAHAKVIAYPPEGNCGWIYRQERGNWELIYPFELERLLLETFGLQS